MNVIETSGLGRRYGRRWALRDCSLAIPEGHLVALVGPNGAGKSTLLNLVVGLTTPTAGRVLVLGAHPAGSAAARDGIGFVGQDMPLYRYLSVRETLHLTRNLNVGFDCALARGRLRELGIDEKQQVGRLSGGQRAQLALVLALARHPRLLVLDEPTAALDPLARHDFMAVVLTAMVDEGVSVLLSSHLMAELERIADYLVLIRRGSVRVDDTVEHLLATHRLISAASAAQVDIGDWTVIESNAAESPARRLVRLASPEIPMPPGCEGRPVGLEELTLAYLRETAAPRLAASNGATR